MSSTDDLLSQRGEIYGDAVETHGRIAQVWSGILGKEISAHDVALCMVGLKMVRAQISPHHTDSHEDAKAYATIANQISDSWTTPFDFNLNADEPDPDLIDKIQDEFSSYQWMSRPAMSGEDIRDITENTRKLYEDDCDA